MKKLALLCGAAALVAFAGAASSADKPATGIQLAQMKLTKAQCRTKKGWAWDRRRRKCVKIPRGSGSTRGSF